MGRNASHLAEKLETLTPQQVATVEEFVEFMLTRGQEHGLTRVATAASMPAFERVWSNSEDDAYDSP